MNIFSWKIKSPLSWWSTYTKELEELGKKWEKRKKGKKGGEKIELSIES